MKLGVKAKGAISNYVDRSAGAPTLQWIIHKLMLLQQNLRLPGP